MNEAGSKDLKVRERAGFLLWTSRWTATPRMAMGGLAEELRRASGWRCPQLNSSGPLQLTSLLNQRMELDVQLDYIRFHDCVSVSASDGGFAED